MSEFKLKRADGKLEVNNCAFNGADNFVIADLTGKVVTHLEPTTGSGITGVTLHKLSAFQTAPTPANPNPDPVWATTGITFTVTAGQIDRLADLGNGLNWGKCKLVMNNTPTSAHSLGIHCGS
jgi:hypothetical protein